MRAVVGRIHDDGVVGDAQVIQRLEDRADVLVVVNHRVVVFALPAAGLPHALGLHCVRKCMCVKFTQTKNGLPAAFWRLMKSTARAAKSSSKVSIRFLVSGPVS